jgi:hypothetical protein
MIPGVLGEPAQLGDGIAEALSLGVKDRANNTIVGLVEEDEV